MSELTIFLFIVFYITILIVIAQFAEKYKNKKLIKSPLIYTLSLGVYCTAWTYFGAVGTAADFGVSYLPIYIGPLIIAPFFPIIINKVVRISRYFNIGSIADFLSVRYGNSKSIGVLITFICLIGIIPYISLQLKAISTGYLTLTNVPLQESLLNDKVFYVTIIMGLFIAYFGNKNPNVTSKHSGVVATIAVESILKLIIFLGIGCYVVLYIFDGYSDIISKAVSTPNFKEITTFNSDQIHNWIAICTVSGFSIFLLPRLFQISIIENYNYNQIKQSAWMFPLYLLAFNLFVIGIALGGNVLFPDQLINSDFYVLQIPLSNGDAWVSMLVFIGGFSAAMSMIIASTLALSNMITNQLLLPYLLNLSLNDNKHLNSDFLVTKLRMIFSFGIVNIGYFFYKYIIINYSFYSIGLISFTIIAQFAPAYFGGMFWKEANKKAAFWSVLIGFLIVFYILVLPSFLPTDLTDLGWILTGAEYFKIHQMDLIPAAIFWSLLVNIVLYVCISLVFNQSIEDKEHAELYVNIDRYYSNDILITQQKALLSDFKNIMIRYLGVETTLKAIENVSMKYQLRTNALYADPKLIRYGQRLLSARLGTSSSKTLINSVLRKDDFSMPEVLKILDESKDYIATNEEWEKQNVQLKITSDQLKEANRELKSVNDQKNEFLDTVAHELKTPLTSIKSFTELIKDDEDLDQPTQKMFLEIMDSEIDRLTRLINSLLDVEKFESGKQTLNLSNRSMMEVVNRTLELLSQQIKKEKVEVLFSAASNFPKTELDYDRMIQVMQNILSNALKFCNPTKGKVWIRVYLMPDNNIKIEIEDNGKGIPEQELSLVFDKFYQAKNQNDKSHNGSGLGLSICQTIVKLHSGHIWLENSSNGFRVNITLPITKQNRIT